jgi:hypothetical protein
MESQIPAFIELGGGENGNALTYETGGDTGTFSPFLLSTPEK